MRVTMRVTMRVKGYDEGYDAGSGLGQGQGSGRERVRSRVGSRVGSWFDAKLIHTSCSVRMSECRKLSSITFGQRRAEPRLGVTVMLSRGK